MDDLDARVAVAVRRSPFFRKKETAEEPAVARLFDLLVKNPDGVATKETNSVTVNRLNERLDECFKRDHSLWTLQRRLSVPQRGKGNYTLQSGPLSRKLSPTLKFWFAQCRRLPSVQGAKQDLGSTKTKDPQTFIVSSEPLFFFSKSLRAYFRLLDVNNDDPFDEKNIADLVAGAKNWIDGVISKSILTKDGMPKATAVSAPVRQKGGRRITLRSVSAKDTETPKTQTEHFSGREKDEFIQKLDLVPVRSYIPAGDADAAVTIRDWFRTTETIEQDIRYKGALHVAPDDFTESNLVVLASRCTNPLLKRFQNETKEAKELRIRLTETGITIDDQALQDKTDSRGFHFVRVVVTNWTLETGYVHTYIASNHSRAIDSVARFLTTDNEALDAILNVLISPDGTIPHRFQLAFDVELQLNESRAKEPTLLPDLNGKRIVY